MDIQRGHRVQGADRGQPRQVIGRNANRVRGIGSTPPRSVDLVYQQITGKVTAEAVTEGYEYTAEEIEVLHKILGDEGFHELFAGLGADGA